MGIYQTILASLGGVLMAIGLSGPVMAQADFPSKPLKLIVAFPPGGTSDVLGRMMADELSKVLKQPVVVENIAGAGGIVGMDRALKMPADGYTLIQTGVGQNAVAHGLDPNLKYNSMNDFIHLTQVNYGPNVLVAHPNQPFKTVKDVVDFAKKNLNDNYVIVYKHTGEDKSVQKVVKPEITPVNVNREDQSEFLVVVVLES